MTAMEDWSPFAPSELVFLNGESFADTKGMFNKVKLIHTDQQVSAPDLVQAMITAALLANEQAGALRVEIQEKKALLGKKQALFATPTGQLAQWPPSSLEAEFLSLAVSLQAKKGQNEVWRLVHDWLGKQSQAPWLRAVELVKQALAARALLEVEEVKKLKIFTEKTYRVPENTRQLLAGRPIDGIQHMLSDFERQRPEEHKLLVKNIKNAIKRRTESQDVDF